MRIIKIDYKNPDSEIIKKVAHAINKGKLAIVPGDAVYTLVGDAFNKDALQKIFKVKKRDKGKAFNLGLYCLEDIANYGQFNPLVYEIQKKFPQEPFTFVVSRKVGKTPDFLNPGYNSLGFRVPFNRVTSTLSKFHREPVIGTSANISELDNTYSVEQLLEYFRGVFGGGIEPDIVLDAGRLPERRPSTVVEIIGNELKVIREGEINEDSLADSIKKIVESFKQNHKNENPRN